MAKITNKIKKVSQKLRDLSGKTKIILKKAVAPKKKQPLTRASTARFLKTITAQEAKYFTYPEERAVKGQITLDESPVSRIQKTELPQKYDKDVMVLMVRDPWWLYAYWEVLEATAQRLKREIGSLFNTAKKALRVYDVTAISFNGLNAHRYFDIEIAHNACNWYIEIGSAGRSWCVDLGFKLADGRFITVVRSNIVTAPLEGPSQVTDEEWMVPEDLFVKLYATAVGLGGSPVRLKKPWLELKKRGLASGGISSAGFSPAKRKPERQRKFWLVVNTELIVYGATEPDAAVTICGKPITLRSDGTFSSRFSLPDGKQVIPVKGKSSDGIDEITITPVVTKQTM